MTLPPRNFGVRWIPDPARGDLGAVRWYLRYGLSYRDVEELLAKRGITVEHVTVYRVGAAVHPGVHRGRAAVPPCSRRPLVSHVQARVPGAGPPPANARATATCPASASIVTLLPIPVPRTAPPPSRPARPEKGPRCPRRAQAHARPAHPRTSSQDQPPPRPVRGRPRKHRRCAPTVPAARTDRPDSTGAPVRYASVYTAT